MANRLIRPHFFFHFMKKRCWVEDVRPWLCVGSHGNAAGFDEEAVRLGSGRPLNPRGSRAVSPWNLEDGRSCDAFSGVSKEKPTIRPCCFTLTSLRPMASGAGGDDPEDNKFSEGISNKTSLCSADNNSPQEEQSEKLNDNLEDVLSIDGSMKQGTVEAVHETLDTNGAPYDSSENSMLKLDDADDDKDGEEVNEEDEDEEDYLDEEYDEYDKESDTEAESEGSGSLLAHLQAVPKRQRQFLLQKALKIPTKKHRVKIVKRKVLALREFLMRQMRVVDVNRTCKVTKGGGVLNFTAFVVCGNCDGVAAFGKGKGQEVGEAVAKAQLRAIKNLHYFDIYMGHTIYHEIEAKYGKTKIHLWPAHSGVGMRASPVVKDILQLAGYKDVKSKVIGSRHPHNTVKAVFKALSMIESPEELSERVGSMVVESRFVQ